MKKLSVAVALVGSGLLTGSAAGHAQQLLLHFPLDGSPQAFGQGAGDSKVYVAAGGAAPVTVPGRHGQALRFDGTASIAMPFSLDAQAYPAVTVTAWVKAHPDSTGERTVFSAGNGNVPRLSVYGDRARFVAARSSLGFSSGMTRDEWVFVAGVVDVASARLAVHQGDGRQDRAAINTENLYPPSNYRNPDDPSLPATRYVFVGSHDFKQWPARQMAIDDVRVYAGALTAEQLNGIRDGAGASVHPRLPRKTAPTQLDSKAIPGDQFDPKAPPGG